MCLKTARARVNGKAAPLLRCGIRKIYERLDFLDKIDDKEKVEKWQKHLKCLTNPLAK
jgi:hypothetical protein